MRFNPLKSGRGVWIGEEIVSEKGMDVLIPLSRVVAFGLFARLDELKFIDGFNPLKSGRGVWIITILEQNKQHLQQF